MDRPTPAYPLMEQAAHGWPLSMISVEIRFSPPTLRRGLTSVVVRPGVVDDNAVEYFGYGGCCLLAGALHGESGWPLVVAQRLEGDTTLWRHMGVRTPGGEFLDINGPRPFHAVIAEYDAAWVHVVTLEEAVSAGAIAAGSWDRKCTSPVVAETIRYFADRLISQAE